jgi:hypothetical protein
MPLGGVGGNAGRHRAEGCADEGRAQAERERGKAGAEQAMVSHRTPHHPARAADSY